ARPALARDVGGQARQAGERGARALVLAETHEGGCDPPEDLGALVALREGREVVLPVAHRPPRGGAVVRPVVAQRALAVEERDRARGHLDLDEACQEEAEAGGGARDDGASPG